MLTFSNFGSFSLIFAPFADLLKKSDNSTHGGSFPGVGSDFDPMPLPPRVRPFILGRYAQPAHVLPRAVFRQFTNFDERAPGDLLLREPEHHLSHEAREVFTSFSAFFVHFELLPCFKHTV